MAITHSSKSNGQVTPAHGDFVATSQYELTDSGDMAATKTEEPSMGWMLARELIETIVLSLIIFLLIRQVVQNYRIESHSMEPNFYEGQFILVNKLAYRLGSPQRGDVIVFQNPNNPDEDYIKRVIALPGDTLEIRDQHIIINGEVQDEPYPLNEFQPNTVYGPEVIQPNHLFVMGDNRPNSRDSRSFGQLDEDLVIGKTWVRVFPLSVFGPVTHYDLQPSASAEQGQP
jgi:signal peptidase I